MTQVQQIAAVLGIITFSLFVLQIAGVVDFKTLALTGLSEDFNALGHDWKATNLDNYDALNTDEVSLNVRAGGENRFSNNANLLLTDVNVKDKTSVTLFGSYAGTSNTDEAGGGIGVVVFDEKGNEVSLGNIIELQLSNDQQSKSDENSDVSVRYAKADDQFVLTSKNKGAQFSDASTLTGDEWKVKLVLSSSVGQNNLYRSSVSADIDNVEVIDPLTGVETSPDLPSPTAEEEAAEEAARPLVLREVLVEESGIGLPLTIIVLSILIIGFLIWRKKK